MKTVLTITLALLAAGAAADDTVAQHQLTLSGAKRVAASALDYALRNKAPGGAITIVDTGGRVVYLERLDNTFPAAADISVGKARTAVLFKKPTRVFENIVVKGRTSMLTLPAVTGFTPLQGGVPLERDGEIVGAIGVSGASSAQQDDDIASAAAAVFAAGKPQASAVSHIKAKRVLAALGKGKPMLRGPHYKVDASRRDGAGEAEVHQFDTGIFYVLDGAATLVTGGTLVNGRETEPGELRGSAIQGGERIKLARGDVVSIPNGVPHWFSKVNAPFTYYVVKSLERMGG